MNFLTESLPYDRKTKDQIWVRSIALLACTVWLVYFDPAKQPLVYAAHTGIRFAAIFLLFMAVLKSDAVIRAKQNSVPTNPNIKRGPLLQRAIVYACLVAIFLLILPCLDTNGRMNLIGNVLTIIGIRLIETAISKLRGRTQMVTS